MSNCYIVIHHEPNREQFNPTRVLAAYSSKEEVEKALVGIKIRWEEPSTSYQIAGWTDVDIWILERPFNLETVSKDWLAQFSK